MYAALMIYTGIMIHIMDFHPRRQKISTATKMRQSAPKARKIHEMTVKASGGVYVFSMTEDEDGKRTYL